MCCLLRGRPGSGILGCNSFLGVTLLELMLAPSPQSGSSFALHFEDWDVTTLLRVGQSSPDEDSALAEVVL